MKTDVNDYDHGHDAEHVAVAGHDPVADNDHGGVDDNDNEIKRQTWHQPLTLA